METELPSYPFSLEFLGILSSLLQQAVLAMLSSPQGTDHLLSAGPLQISENWFQFWLPCLKKCITIDGAGEGQKLATRTITDLERLPYKESD